MSDDPFAPSTNDAPTDPWANSAPFSSANAQEASVTVPAENRDRFSIKLTLKANNAYDAEWINPWVSGQTAQEAAANTVAMLKALADHGVIEMVSNAAEFARTQYKGQAGASGGAQRSGGGGNGGGGGNYQRRANGNGGGNSLPPGVEQKSCQHGGMIFRSGTNKWNKPYQAFFCPTDQNAPDKCKPIFLDN
ncbi:hypothetical protein [Spirillospora sp. NPDC047279]|uniref:hypothetical protein n=1 Tax=Spirillospora sp. NPDC047279 TaxID=3155478 RepID=UPI0033CEAABD